MGNEAHANMNSLFELPECDGPNAAGNPVWALDSAVPTFVEADLSFNTGSERGAVRIHKFGADAETNDDMNEVEALGLALVAAARSIRSVRELRTFADARAAGVPADVFDDVESIARSMTSALPTIHIYDQLVGPFYDTPGLTQWRGVSRQAINKAVSAGTVIACRLDGGQCVYPTWQFTDSQTVHPHLITLWQTLRESADPWACAIWLRSPQEELGDRSAADWITGGHPVAPALELARADAQRWAV